MAGADPTPSRTPAAGPRLDTEPFAPRDVVWQRIDPRWATAQRLVGGIVAGVAAVVLGVLAVLVTPWVWLGFVVLVPLWFWDFSWARRQVRAWGYAERDDDLLVVHGILFRTLVVVPYGRLQYVDVEAGPVDRKFGLAKVQLHTASSDTDAAIPGLRPEEAARLRDRLASRGEARLAGL
ncbi:PH domain-containing protein [Kineococcus sp. NPDC059986]|jgi:membrane protein YdbS with pleckstrin-like domain|uniref:PH domain-containing protein n=1 Tax=Kineococcus sp. NPDC059986 TaxID=3155538 RepID=UPI00344E27B9